MDIDHAVPLTFRRPLGDALIRQFLMVLTLSTFFLPFIIISIRDGTPINFKYLCLYFLNDTAICIVFSVLVASLVFVRLANSSLGYPIRIDDCKITQKSWFGLWRTINWEDVERIQVLDVLNNKGSRLYRVRIFSNKTVIVFGDCYENEIALVEFIQDKASHFEIPIYEEKGFTSIKFRLGSWPIDASGMSLGVSLSQIDAIPLP